MTDLGAKQTLSLRVRDFRFGSNPAESRARRVSALRPRPCENGTSRRERSRIFGVTHHAETKRCGGLSIAATQERISLPAREWSAFSHSLRPITANDGRSISVHRRWPRRRHPGLWEAAQNGSTACQRSWLASARMVQPLNAATWALLGPVMT